MMEAILSSETPVLKRATGRHIPEDGILQLGKLSEEYVTPAIFRTFNNTVISVWWAHY
jgi:hypothetical protein